MIDPRLTDVRAALIHLEGLESALERAGALSQPDDDVGTAITGAEVFTAWIRTGLERVLRLVDPDARDPLARRADEPRIRAGS